MNRFSFLAPLVVGATAIAAAQASAAASGFYLGVGLGPTTFHHDVTVFDDGSLAGSGRVDAHDTGWKLFGGYRLGTRLSFEIGHTVLNNDYDVELTFSRGTSDGSGVFSLGEVGVDIHRPRATFAVAVGELPLDERIAVFGRVGVQAWQSDVTTFQSTGVSTERESGLDGLAGLGLTWRVAGNWELRIDYERFMGVVDDDIDLFSMGFVYRFRTGRSSTDTSSYRRRADSPDSWPSERQDEAQALLDL